MSDMEEAKPLRGVWYPIEIAPKDETHFLGYDRNSGMYECWWFVSRRGDEAYWMNVPDNEPQPTHWMPLPNPPGHRSATDNREQSKTQGDVAVQQSTVNTDKHL